MNPTKRRNASILSAPGARWEGYVFVAIAMLGIAIRLAVYLYNKSLWLDETWVALNVLGRSFGGLLQRLDYNIVHPPLFLIISKAIHYYMGHLEFSLRFLPLLGGCLATFLFARLLQRTVPGFFGICAASLYGFGIIHINWATSFKHYALDQLASALLLWAAIEWDRLSVTRRYAVAAALPILLWLSFTSAFILIGLVLVVGLSALKEKTRGTVSIFAILLIATCVSALSLYAAAARHSLGNEQLTAAWAQGYPSSPYCVWLGRSLLEVFGTACGAQYGPLLALFFCLLGCWRLMKSGRMSIVVLAASTLAAALVASFMRVYPFMSGRVSAYWSPVALLLFAAGLEALWRAFRRSAIRWCVVALAAVVVAVNLFAFIDFGSLLFVKEEMRYVANALNERHDREAPILVSSVAGGPFRIYGGPLLHRRVVWLTKWELDAHEIDVAWLSAEKPEGFWLVLTHSDFDQSESLFDSIKPFGRVTDEIRKGWSGAYLIEAVRHESPTSDDDSRMQTKCEELIDG